MALAGNQAANGEDKAQPEIARIAGLTPALLTPLKDSAIESAAHATNRAYRLLSIFFLFGLPATLFVVTLVAFVSWAGLNWMKRNA